MPLFVHVDRTWDGQSVAPELRTELALALAGEWLEVRVDAAFHGDPPPIGPPGPTPRLWEHEVVELFVAQAEAPTAEVEYLELELSPHGHHLVLRLRGVRRPREQGLPLDFSATIDTASAPGPRWRGIARVPRGWLPPPPHRVAAFAVDGGGASRRHLASLTLPGDRPDFHQPHRFPRMTLPGSGERSQYAGRPGTTAPGATMQVRRIVANISTRDPAEADAFYGDVLGLELAMDHGWIRTYVAPDQRSTQVSFASQGGSGTPVPDLSIEVDDLAEALRRVQRAGIPLEYGPVTEPWGVRRFYVRDPSGRLVNILQHESADSP